MTSLLVSVAFRLGIDVDAAEQFADHQAHDAHLLWDGGSELDPLAVQADESRSRETPRIFKLGLLLVDRSHKGIDLITYDVDRSKIGTLGMYGSTLGW